ncbi:uroporphyrinogen-III synthase [Asaia siamensis]|uniref:Uroporphyrinogen-III synthase n=1 Tax=Asaia siamensis TaxID=110479 RepID=A0ABQ1LDD4_9PROT|nr:uroporphyrinogen-III synthase [Asaia siamensis]GBR08390.1 uroporphyrinogen-III synthase [Asaia siamensis NRIC 0323]GGC22901.1 uroporphyrinogen III methyltransferase [Asaia siamensis]
MADLLRRTVLVTRPEPGLSDTGLALERLGWEPCLAPMLRVHPLPMKPSGAVDRVVITSGQSLQALQAALPFTTPLTAVGARTAERARTLGFTNVDYAEGTAHSLVGHLGKAGIRNRVLLATGEKLGGELAIELRMNGWHVTRRVVYRTETTGALTPAARSLIEQERVAAILFYSAATARAFLDAFGAERRLLGSVRALALSPAIGRTLDAAPFSQIAIAPRPEQQALLALLGPLPTSDIDIAGRQIAP